MPGSHAKSDSDRLETRRLHAIDLLRAGASQADVARRLGVTREAVRQWVAAWRGGGRPALAARPRRRGSKVSLLRVADVVEQARRDQGPLSTERVQELIAATFGIQYSASSVRAILRRLGFSYDRAAGWRRTA